MKFALILAALLVGNAQAETVVLKKSIQSVGPANEWLGVNAVGIVQGEIVAVTTELSGRGCQLTRQTRFGTKIQLAAGTQLEMGTPNLFIAEKPNCLEWDFNSPSGDPSCISYGSPDFEAVYTRIITAGSDSFSLNCSVPQSRDHSAASALFEQSVLPLF